MVGFAEVPFELPALMALGILATASQKRFVIHAEGSYSEPLNLFVCPAMEPGERKTSVVATLSKPLRRWENDQRTELAPLVREQESHRKTAERRIEHLRGKAAKTEDPIERDDLQREIDAIEREQPPEIQLPLLVIDDCTPEHVATLLHRHGERLAIVTDEGGVFDIAAGRYSRGVPNLDVFLNGHSGGQTRVHRGSREPVDLQNPCLTMAISCQPYVLQEIGANKAFKGRGLLARFLFAIPTSRLGYRSLITQEIPATVMDRWQRVVCTLLDIDQPVDEWNQPTSRKLMLSPESYRVWKAEQRANELDMRPGALWSSNTGWASKYPGAVLRIAGVLHCAVCADKQRDPASQSVDESTMVYAVRLGQKIKSHTLKAFGMMALTDDQKYAIRITEWIKRDRITEFTGRECSIHCNSAGSVKDLDGAFEILIDRGWVRRSSERKPEGKGRPSHPFEVNPAIAELDDKNDINQPDLNERSILSLTSAVPAHVELQNDSDIDWAAETFQ